MSLHRKMFDPVRSTQANTDYELRHNDLEVRYSQLQSVMILHGSKWCRKISLIEGWTAQIYAGNRISLSGRMSEASADWFDLDVCYIWLANSTSIIPSC
jgi:hypothetical protein